MDFPQNVTLFVSFTQNIQNVISVERSIFADVVAYQFINFETFTRQHVTPAEMCISKKNKIKIIKRKEIFNKDKNN